MSRKGYQRIAVIVFVLCILVIAGCLVYMEVEKSKVAITSADANRSVVYHGDASEVTYNGETYKYNTNMKAILFMGIDTKDEVTGETLAGRGGQSDTLMLLILNTAEKKVRILEISRNTMTTIDIYDVSNELLSTKTAQLTLQYAYGDGGIRSCQITKDKVSDLLHNIPIRSYISLNIDGIHTVVDAMGGIPITIPADYTDLDPSFQAGKKLTLDGALAEKYVRSRDTETSGSNEDRMKRQSEFVDAFVLQGKKLLKEDSSLVEEVVKAADSYLLTDLDLDTMEDLSSYEVSSEILKVPGEDKHGELYDEFYVDEAGLEKQLIELFYTKK